MLDPRSLPGYEFQEAIYEGADSLIYRARRASDQCLVIIKTGNARHLLPEFRARLRREYSIGSSLPSDIAPYLDLVETAQGPALVMKDTGGVPLSQWLPDSLKKLLEGTLRIALGLDIIHETGIVHRDIKPQNIILDPRTLHPAIIDYGIASRLVSRNDAALQAERLEGTLLYMAPEQTGRTNRRVDHRSDLYSLGATFYELITGQPPYPLKDSLQLIHAHLASTPAPIQKDRNGNFVPAIVNDIVQKLMSRDPDARYQTAMGLAQDLKKCLQLLEGKNQIPPFETGQLDFPRGLTIPQKLYGRQRELQQIHSALENSPTLVLVTGPSGSGKSSLIQELRRNVAERNGFFLPGKFEPDKKDIPYYAISQGLSLIAESLLSLDNASVQTWKNTMLQKLRGNGQALLELVPALSQLLGPQPELQELAPEEERVRFRLTILGFLSAFDEMPLVFVLDDLQWADLASLDLIQDLLLDSGSNLSILGTYRDNEVNDLHPLTRAMESYRQHGISTETIQLQPLGPRDLRMLLMDTLRMDPADSMAETVNQLADALYKKSEGNPFIARQYLESSYNRGWIRQDRSNGQWHIEMARIRTDGLTASAAELLAARIEDLDELKSTLEAAACLGSRFDLTLLSGILEQDVLHTARQLQELSARDLIYPLNESYKYVSEDSTRESIAKVAYGFSHDRVHEAVLNQIPSRKFEELNLQTARLIVRESDFQQIEEKIGTIVAHYNRGRNLVQDDEEKLQIARLNVQAGRRERKSSAYDEAIIHFGIARDTLHQRSAAIPADLRMEILRNLGECEYLNGRKVVAQEFFDQILKDSRSQLDKLKVYEFKIALLSSDGHQQEAVSLGIQALKKAGHAISPLKDAQRDSLIKSSIKDARKIPELVRKKRKKEPDAQSRLIARIFSQTITPAFLTRSDRLPSLVFALLDWSEKKGPFPETAVALVVLGTLSCEHLRNYEQGQNMGRMAQDLVERFNARELRGRVNYYYLSSIHSWSESIQSRLPLYERAYDQCLESGDLPFAALCVFEMLSQRLLYCNESLDDLDRLYEKYDAAIGRTGQSSIQELFGLVRQALHSLKGASRQKDRLRGDFFDEKKAQSGWQNTGASRSLFYLELYRRWLSTLFFQESREPGKISGSEAPLSHYDALFRDYLTFIQRMILDKKSGVPPELKPLLEKMENLEQSCADNFALFRAHLQAESAWQEQRIPDAMTAFDRACQRSRKSGPVLLAGFMQERTAHFYLELRKPVFASIYAKRALDFYRRLKSHAQIEQTERLLDEIRLLHEELAREMSFDAESLDTLTESAARDVALLDPSSGRSIQSDVTSGESGSELDLESVMRTAAIVSSEIELDQLLRKLMHSLIESAGARKVVLLEKSSDDYLIRAMQDGDQEPLVGELRKADPQQDIPESILRYTDRTLKSTVLDNASQEGSFTEDPYIQARNVSSALCIPILLKGEVSSLMYLEHSTTRGAFSPHRVRVLNLLGAQIATSLENARLYEDVKEALQQEQKARKSEERINTVIRRFVPDEFLKILGVESFSEIKLGENIEREMTVLFSDIRAFTSLSESMTPEDTFRFINSYLSRIGPLVRESGGFIDKYIGDAVMALFEKPDQAIRAARAMMLELASYNDHRKLSGYDPVRIGIGVHTGVLRLGIIGEEGRIEGTVIGDTVNTASRLESLNPGYGTSIIVSDATRSFMKDSSLFHFRALDRVRVKGKSRDLWIYELQLNPASEANRELYDRALQAYQDASLSEAREHFLKLKAECPDDPVIQFYLDRIHRLEEHGIPENWEGIENLTKK
ncbi:MAG: hypothetical protein CMN77_18815 [Spirochaetaceae bacterium]|nr:hypothetical protein [Spirochaetaceae bacterium]|tara:strand:+ start:5594 stop:10990 length:5397 start_codon:yes stop_codon:yes gene_type:complete